LAELHCHGGRAVVRAVLGAILSIDGVREAQPGEFTRRALINGRIDLTEAEGLADLLSAETEAQRRAAIGNAQGVLATAVDGWTESLLLLSAQVEAEIDFADEDDVPDSNLAAIVDQSLALAARIDAALAQPTTEALRSGISVVIAGPPNSGKSTLLNALVDREAAIVSDTAGTTRDMIEIPVSFAGIPFVFVDTAGLRKPSDDAIEAIGIARAQERAAQADIILWLGGEGEGPAHHQLVEIAAKVDIPGAPRKSNAAIRLSAATGAGLPQLWARLETLAGELIPPPDALAVNARQAALLAEASAALRAVVGQGDWLLLAEHLRLARRAFDAITGKSGTEAMLDALFGRFCIGK
jgi:tRNA modification GTPase